MNITLPFYIHPDDAPSKQAILRSALALFVRKGLCDTSIRDIADDAGYTNPALFKFFAGKDALALYLFQQCYHRFAAALAEAARADDTAEAKLRGVIARSCALIDESPEAFLYMQDNLRLFWPRIADTARESSMIGLLQRLVDACKAEGFANQDIDTTITVAGIAGLSIQFARLLYFGEIQGRAQDWQTQITRTAIGMLRA